MNPTLREDIAVIGTVAAALIIGALAIFGAIVYGILYTLALEGVFLGAYILAWGMLRLTTKPLRRPAPAAPTTGPDEDDDLGRVIH